MFVINFSPECVPGKVNYVTRGWPIEFFWSNETQFILGWFLVDFMFYLLIGMFLFTILIPTIKKLLVQK